MINYPVLVGDMDGSGSRGITWLLRAGGVWMRYANLTVVLRVFRARP